ncbi:MAG TPA: response regulator [Gammaproteobacteria bacterium]|nr:response regulator [Gammaproteobacteria bacterium]
MNTNKTILIVDDDEMIHRFFNLFLAREGYRITFSRDRESALHSINSQAPDLIFIDINLGDENGGLLCKDLKDQGNLQDIPILLISGVELSSDECKKFRADGFVTKPMDIRNLKELIKSCLF